MADEDNGFSSGAVAFAFLAGAIIGAGAALLLAPQTGEDTRKLLRKYAKEAEKEVRARAEEAQEALEDVIEQGKKYVNDKKSVLTAAFEAGREAMKKER